MRKAAFFVLAAFLGLTSFSQGIDQPQFSGPDVPAADWVQVGPMGGAIQGLAVNPVNKSEMYAVTSGYPGSVYRSANAGNSWARVSLQSSGVYDVDLDPVNPNTVYVLGSYAVFRSLDKGATWAELSLPNGGYASSGRLVFHPRNPNVLFVCGYFYISSNNSVLAVFKSTDGGQNWTTSKLNTGSSWGNMTGIAISPTNPDVLYSCGYYRTPNNQYIYRIFKTVNGGKTWTNISGPLDNTPNDITVSPLDPNKVFVATAWAVFRSVNGGGSWQKNSGYAYAYALGIDPQNPSTIYAGYNKEVYKSTDGGASFKKAASVSGACNVFAFAPGKVYCASAAGLYLSQNGGQSWTAKNSGIKASDIPALCLAPSSPNTIYAEAAGCGFFKSTNSGASWTKLPDFYRCESIIGFAVNPANPNEVFILAGG